MLKATVLAVCAALLLLVAPGVARADIGDSATGVFDYTAVGGCLFEFSATSGPNGESAAGDVSCTHINPFYDFGGEVTCLRVFYDAGALRASVTYYTATNNDPGRVGYWSFTVQDNPVGDDAISGLTGAAGPSECLTFDTRTADRPGGVVVILDNAVIGPHVVTLSPPDAVNNVGTSHTVTATVTNAAGSPVAGATVLFKVQGADSVSGSCVTGSNGQCSFSYQGPQLPGADVITGCEDANANGTADAGEPCGVATKAWIFPTTTPGQVTGGGQILNAGGNDQIAFGFNAKSDAKGVKGECTIVDPSTDTKVKCLDATTLVRSGTHATFFGNATVNGTATTYRIDVDDLGEPGRGQDTFKVQTSSGYTVGGTLVNGNIQIHK